MTALDFLHSHPISFSTSHLFPFDVRKIPMYMKSNLSLPIHKNHYSKLLHFLWHIYIPFLIFVNWGEDESKINCTICFDVPVVWISLGTLGFVPTFRNSLISFLSGITFLSFVLFALASSIRITFRMRRWFLFLSRIEGIHIVRKLKKKKLKKCFRNLLRR